MGPVIVLVIVVFGLMGLASVAMRSRLEAQGYRPAAAPPTADPGHSFDDSTSASFRGGSCGPHRWPAHLGRPAECPRRTGSTWPAPRSTAARSTHTSGIRFEAGDGRYDGVIFWTFDPDSVLDALRERGWPVSDDDAATAPD